MKYAHKVIFKMRKNKFVNNVIHIHIAKYVILIILKYAYHAMKIQILHSWINSLSNALIYAPEEQQLMMLICNV